MSDGCDLECLSAWQVGDTCRHGVKQTSTFQIPAVVRLNKPLAFMWNKFGAGPEGRTCKDCVRLRANVTGSRRTYYKCGFYGVSSSEATDWRLRWPACGIFEEDPGAKNRSRNQR